MIKNILISFLTLCAIIFAGGAFAATDVKFTIGETTDTSAKVSWEEQGLGYYYLYLGTTAGDLQQVGDNFLEVNSYELTGLQKGVDYYIALTTISEEGEESEKSEEFSFKLGSMQGEDFKLLEVNPIYTNRISLTFNSPLNNSDDEIREFKIVNSMNEFNELEVMSSMIDPENNKKLILELASEMIQNQEYIITIISLSDVNGKVISSGMDAKELFEVSDEIQVYDPSLEVEVIVTDEEVIVETDGNNNEVMNEIIVNQEVINEEVVNEEVFELNSGGDEEEETSIVGELITDDNLAQDTLSAVSEAEKLPETGPEHVLIFILTFILGTLVFVLRYKKI